MPIWGQVLVALGDLSKRDKSHPPPHFRRVLRLGIGNLAVFGCTCRQVNSSEEIGECLFVCVVGNNLLFVVNFRTVCYWTSRI